MQSNTIKVIIIIFYVFAVKIVFFLSKIEIPYLSAVADENGNIKLFKTHPKFELIKGIKMKNKNFD